MYVYIYIYICMYVFIGFIIGCECYSKGLSFNNSLNKPIVISC